MSLPGTRCTMRAQGKRGTTTCTSEDDNLKSGSWSGCVARKGRRAGAQSSIVSGWGPCRVLERLREVVYREGPAATTRKESHPAQRQAGTLPGHSHPTQSQEASVAFPQTLTLTGLSRKGARGFPPTNTCEDLKCESFTQKTYKSHKASRTSQ